MTKRPTVKVKPKPDCKACLGSGEVTDWVPYGMGSTAMNSLCDCVIEQVDDPDDTVEVEVDLSDYDPGPDYPEPEMSGGENIEDAP